MTTANEIIQRSSTEQLRNYLDSARDLHANGVIVHETDDDEGTFVPVLTIEGELVARARID